jgi:hypothetical protein
MKRAVRGLFALALINAGCSSAAEPTAGSSAEPAPPSAASPAPEAPARERLTRTIPRTAQTWVTVHTLPLAECTLEAIDTSLAPEAADPLMLVSDAEGSVHFQSRATDPRASSVAMHLDCTDGAGKTASQEIDLVVDDAATAAPAPAARVSRVRPALVGDPMSYTREELVAHDLPPRPDPVASPKSFARWLELATRPVNVIEPETVVSSHARRGVERPAVTPDAIPTQSTNWCGNFISDPSRDYFYVYGTWNLPHITNQGGFWSTTYSATWLGLGFTQDIIQDGIEQNTSSRVWVENSTNYAVYEWFPADPVTIANFPVSPGDEITAWAWMVDGNNYFSDAGQFADYMLYDATTGNLTSYSKYAKPFAQASMATESADWIVELPGGTSQLAHFATFTMSDAWAEGFHNHALVDFSESGNFDTQPSLVDANGNVMASVTPAGPGAMTFIWNAYQ